MRRILAATLLINPFNSMARAALKEQCELVRHESISALKQTYQSNILAGKALSSALSGSPSKAMTFSQEAIKSGVGGAVSCFSAFKNTGLLTFSLASNTVNFLMERPLTALAVVASSSYCFGVSPIRSSGELLIAGIVNRFLKERLTEDLETNNSHGIQPSFSTAEQLSAYDQEGATEDFKAPASITEDFKAPASINDSNGDMHTPTLMYDVINASEGSCFKKEFFNVELVKDDGDCAFYALGLSRENAIQKVINVLESPDHMYHRTIIEQLSAEIKTMAVLLLLGERLHTADAENEFLKTLVENVRNEDIDPFSPSYTISPKDLIHYVIKKYGATRDGKNGLRRFDEERKITQMGDYLECNSGSSGSLNAVVAANGLNVVCFEVKSFEAQPDEYMKNFHVKFGKEDDPTLMIMRENSHFNTLTLKHIH